MMQHLAEGAALMGYALSSAQLQQFEEFRTELQRGNESMNLTSIKQPADVEKLHFLDSLTVLLALDLPQNEDNSPLILDVGSGAGFPGIPLKIVLPKARIRMLEATGKKVSFMRQVITTMGLPNIEVLQGRAEELAHTPTLRESFPFVVSRAVAPLATLVELCLPFCSVGGTFIAMKKGDMDAELKAAAHAIRVLGGEPLSRMAVPSKLFEDNRILVTIEKRIATPRSYPRRPGVPSHNPLLKG
ncbi:MAG: 16S rRNA (guanine(527)-N(7))-methyltransferase RsmG [Dehalococcoidia bacterium]|nr:16S rRNA (guanine(527)-N(7))-methyltransferase RsmG [Dehalococcoidia bacterium]